MSICEICHQEMLTADGCVKNLVAIYTTERSKKPHIILEPIRYGDEDYSDETSSMPTLPDRCGDCGAKLGHYHHRQCDIEQCPNCKGQLLTCGGVVCEKVSKPLWWVKP